MDISLVLNLCSKNYSQGVSNALSLNLIDLKTIKASIKKNPKLAVVEIDRLIDFFQKSIQEKDLEIENLQKQYDEMEASKWDTLSK